MSSPEEGLFGTECMYLLCVLVAFLCFVHFFFILRCYSVTQGDVRLSFSSCRKLPRALKDWQAFLDLKKTIDDFNESCPLLELMANKAMKQRHWDRIATLTGHTFEMESETFSLRNIMEAPLLKHKEDIEV